MQQKRIIRRLLRALAICPLVLFAAGPTAADTFTWDGGGSGNGWNDPLNWNPNGVPASKVDTALVMAGVNRLTTVNDAAFPFQLGSLEFDATAGAFSILGSPLEFISTGNTANLTQNSASGMTIQNDLTLTDSLQVSGSGSGAIALTGAIGGSGGLTKEGNFRVTLSGAAQNSYTGLTTVNGGVLELNRPPGGSPSFGGAIRGDLTINNGGTVRLLRDRQIQLGAVVTVNGGTLDMTTVDNTIGRLILSDGGSVVGSPAGVGLGLGNISGDAVTTTGSMPVTIDSRLFLHPGGLPADSRRFQIAPDAPLTVNGVIWDGGGGNGSLTKEGAGILTLAAANAFSGPVEVVQGKLVVTHSAALGSSAAGTVIHAVSSAELQLSGGIVVDGEPLSFEFVPLPQVNQSGRLRNVAGNNRWTGPIHIDGPGTLGSGAAIVEIRVDAGQLTLDGPIDVTDRLSALIFNGPGSIVLNAASPISGTPIVVQTFSTVYAGNDLAFGTSDITFTGSSLSAINGPRNFANKLKMSISSLRIFGEHEIEFSGIVELPNTLPPSQLTARIQVENPRTTLSGQLTGNAHLRIVGPGTLALSGTSPNWSGSVIVEQGTLDVASDASLGAIPNAPTDSIFVEGGAVLLAFTGPLHSNRTIVFGYANGPSHGTIDVPSTQNVTVQGLVRPRGGGDDRLVKTGPGTLQLALPIDFPDEVEVAEGTLLANFNGPGRTVTVGSQGRLTTSGWVNRPIAGTGLIVPAGQLLIGDVADPLGFDFSGMLSVQNYDVVLLDANVARLGTASLTGGRLSSAALELTGLLFGNGTINGALRVAGVIIGNSNGLNLLGYVTGPGNITGNVTFSGVYSPGDSPAQVTLGSPTFANRLVLEIGGPTPGTQHDHLLVTGTATLGGILDVDLIDGFVPAIGQAFTLLNYAAHAGQFDEVRLPTLPGGVPWGMHYGETSLTIFTPLPGDINLDGQVDRDDLAAFTDNYGLTTGATWTTGDFNGDGATTILDLDLLQRHLGQSVASSPSLVAVPEPHAAWLAVLIGLASQAWRRMASKSPRRSKHGQ